MILPLPHPQHHTRLRHAHALLLCVLEHGEALPELCAAVPHEGRELFDGLDVVCVDVESGLGDDGDEGEVPGEVACEGFDEDLGCSEVDRMLGGVRYKKMEDVLLLDLDDGLSEVVCSAVC